MLRIRFASLAAALAVLLLAGALASCAFCGTISAERCEIDVDCDNGDPCDGTETCVDLRCAAGTPLDCADEVDCTADFCDDATGSCRNVPDDGACTGDDVCGATTGCMTPIKCTATAECDDGLFCNGAEECLAMICAAGTPPSCADTTTCTIGVCDETNDTCNQVPDHSVCGPGSLCDVVLGCYVVPDCTTPAECDDGLYCDGLETCAGGKCMGGPPPSCADAYACTIDLCDEAADACVLIPNDTACGMNETCSPAAGCIPDCTSPADCDDGLYCNGAEGCVAGGCVTGAPPSCADGATCTVDLCDESTDSCAHLPDDTVCGPAGLCDPASGCLTWGAPELPVQSCLEMQMVEPSSADGPYWADPGGGSIADAYQVYCDMTRNGGGWTLVLQNNGALTPGPDPSYADVVSLVNVTGTFGSTLSAFDLWLRLDHWNLLGTEMRIEVGSSPGSIAKQALYPFSLDPIAGYAIAFGTGMITVGPDEPGLKSYSAVGGWGVTTYDNDIDVYVTNCHDLYGYAWWYGACWSGNFWGSRLGGYADAAYWTGSTTDFYSWGALWVR